MQRGSPEIYTNLAKNTGNQQLDQKSTLRLVQEDVFNDCKTFQAKATKQKGKIVYNNRQLPKPDPTKLFSTLK